MAGRYSAAVPPTKKGKGGMIGVFPRSLRRTMALWLCPELAFDNMAAVRSDSVLTVGGHKRHMLTLAASLGAHENLTHWAISMRFCRKGDFFDGLLRGGDCRTETYERVMLFFAGNWPADLQWPTDVPRPAPDTTRTSTKEANDG
jgi:hypothetical protein